MDTKSIALVHMNKIRETTEEKKKILMLHMPKFLTYDFKFYE